jgi:hypothetical protein
VKSIKKNRIDQKGAIPGNWFIASVNTMNANPVPDAPYLMDRKSIQLYTKYLNMF